ncbi:MAG: hypothetical protein HC926_01125 [Synechococcaceae cyanobacterium SM2_3_60]|nr:hypothetical protein [Synechococcaceae cyanobacterium SM2_3_60]
MGLAERRLIQQLEAEVLPLQTAELQAITSSPVTFVVHWEGFQTDAAAIKGLAEWGFTLINDSFRLICRDALGKEAVANKIKTVEIMQWNSSWPAGSVSWDKLELMWDWSGDERLKCLNRT